MTPSKASVPLREGLWVERPGPDARPQLLGSRCLSCREVFFPRKENGICTYCQSTDLEDLSLSPRGKIYSFTVVMQRPPVYYQGEVPYGLGFVELPEGVRVETLFTGCDPEDLRVGMEVEMVIDRLCEDEGGKEIVTYKFRPTRSGTEV
jgi:uncharacterized OB-fold protein